MIPVSRTRWLHRPDFARAIADNLAENFSLSSQPQVRLEQRRQHMKRSNGEGSAAAAHAAGGCKPCWAALFDGRTALEPAGRLLANPILTTTGQIRTELPDSRRESGGVLPRRGPIWTASRRAPHRSVYDRALRSGAASRCPTPSARAPL